MAFAFTGASCIREEDGTLARVNAANLKVLNVIKIFKILHRIQSLFLQNLSKIGAIEKNFQENFQTIFDVPFGNGKGDGHKGTN